MRYWLISSVASVALLAACGGDKTAAAGDVEQSVKVGDVKIEAVQLRSGDAAKAGAALTALSLDESGAGRVSFGASSADGADATFNDVTISVDDDESPVKAGSLVFKGLDMSGDAANFSQMTLSDISIVPDDEEDGELNVASVQLTNPSPELAAWVGSLMGEGDPAAFPAFETISFDGLSLGGLTLNADGIDEVEAFEIGAIDFRKLSSKGVGSMVIEGINLVAEEDGEPISVSLGSMGIAGLSENMMKAMSAAFASGANDVDPDDLVEELMGLVSANPGDPGYDSFTLDALSADVAGVAFDLPSMAASVTRDEQGRATRAVTNPFKMSLKADPAGELGSQLAVPLQMLGYEELNISGAADMRMDPDADTISYEDGTNYFALDDGFKLSFGGSFAGLSGYYKAVGKSAGDPEASLAALAALTVNNMELNFEDNSIVDKGFAAAAAAAGQDPAGMRAQATAMVGSLPLMAGQFGVDPALAGELSGALSKFLDSSGTLSIKLDPETPLTADVLQDPSALTKDRLGFSAETK